jgi:outer membrane biosynthesis protein TonB
MMRRYQLLTLLCFVAIASAGCGTKHVVAAAPPSVSEPPPEEKPATPPPAPVPAPVAEAPTPQPTPEPTPEPAKRPVARPRPVQPETPAPAPVQPKPAPPQISPALSDSGLAAAKNSTTANLMQANKNLDLAKTKNLNAAQKDLVDKINGFIAQSHDAIVAEDWARAQNLAEKARVLADELVKSF